MGKLILGLLIFICSTLAISIAETTLAKDPESVSKWFDTLHRRRERITKIQFYFHGAISGPNPTAVNVARAESTASSPNLFGITTIADELLTTGPDSESTVVGRAQGVYASSQISGNIALYFSMNLVFTNAQYNGSSLILMGRNAIFEPLREFSIIGGTGVFRLGRGVAIANTFSFDPTSGNTVVEYNVVVSHY